jgi:hypothetical protein
MNASNVRAFTPPVNPSPEDVCNFLRQKADRGELASNSSRLKVTAISALAGILADDEPKTAAYLRDNIASIADRWATLNSAGAKGDTAKTYESRARAAIDDYFAWTKDPKGFKFRRRDTAAKNSPKQKPAETPSGQQPNPQEAAKGRDVQNEDPARRNDAGMRTFPLGSNRGEFRFELPPDGVSVHDVRKIVCHLLTLANDFDPGVPSHAQVFSIVASQKD